MIKLNSNRIVTRIKDTTGIAKSKNRSEDLTELRRKYQQFSKNLKYLITTLTNNHASMVAYGKSRLEVAKAINALTVDTPLFGCAGDIPAAAVGTTDGGSAAPAGGEGGDANSSSTDLVVVGGNNPSSYAAIHLQLHRKNKLYHDKYTEHILNYATEWERILTTRITGHLKQSETLRVDLDHYAKKVEDLHKSINKTMTKGKIVGDENVDKLKRNEAKLAQARQEYDRFVNDLCGLMEEVMLRGWKDLHPLLVKMAQFDTTLSNEESTLLRNGMSNVTERLKGMRNEHPGLKPLGRLKELETWSLESLARANPSGQDAMVVSSGGGEYASYVNAPLGGVGLVHAGLGSRSSDEMHAVGGGGGLFGGGSSIGGGISMPLGPTSSFNSNPGLDPTSRTSSFNSNPGLDLASSGYGQMMVSRSRTGTNDSGGGGYDWATGGLGLGVGGEGGNNTDGGGRRSAPSSGGYDWATGGGGGVSVNAHNGGGRTSSYRAAPSSGGCPLPLSPHEGQSSMSSMLTTMQAAAPPPTLGDIYGLSNNGSSSMSRLTPAVPPPPPSMPPPPPPAPSSHLSMYGNDYQGGGSYPVSMSSESASTNPFDDGGSMRTLSIGGPPPTQATYSNTFGVTPATSGGGGGPYDPFR
ncbi:hypothetical protein ACHAXA_010318 [Cyclostephanos tholiformis]|uniref:Uncharacterized protein n=1 Tax=Cyclostephanos tholiformis TaxID=382380 RepID=A0ABD3RFX2_9STRA